MLYDTTFYKLLSWMSLVNNKKHSVATIDTVVAKTIELRWN